MRPFPALRDELRQRRHHRAFRIAPPPADDALREQLRRLLTKIPQPAEQPPAEQPPAEQPRAEQPSAQQPPARELDEKSLAEAATNVWRAQRRLARDGEASSARDRQAGRYLLACRDALTDAGMVIQEHDGDTYHPGRSIEVLVFHEEPTLTAEVVLETVRPTIYLHDRRIQMGQVIVGRPPSARAANPARQPIDQVRNDHAAQ